MIEEELSDVIVNYLVSKGYKVENDPGIITFSNEEGTHCVELDIWVPEP